MTARDDAERRQAERFPLPKKANATFGGFEARLVEVSLIGCQIEHADRIAPRAHLPLRFKWRGEEVRLEATVVRSEMRSIGGKPAYASGLSVCDSADHSPPVIRQIVRWLAEAAKAAAHMAEPEPEPAATPAAVAAPFLRADDEEPEVVSALYLQCVLSGGKWERLFVEAPDQPPEGFTIVAPSSDSEVEVLCRAYLAATAPKRREMRAAFEHAIVQGRR